jgi:nucleotide-binding universal stress UspA family protein
VYESILVPLDGSKRAEKILPYVQELGLRCGSSAVLLRVVDPFSIVVGPEGEAYTALARQELEDREQEAKSYLTSVGERIRPECVEVRVRVVNGAVVDQIMRVAEQEVVDLIAMTSHGRTGLARAFYGSVAAGVLHRVDRPLLLVRSLPED